MAVLSKIAWVEDEITIAIVGRSGAGKSTMVHYTCPAKPKPMDSLESQEIHSEIFNTIFRARIVDQPGHFDNRTGIEYTNAAHQKQILSFLSSQRIGNLNAIIWAVEGLPKANRDDREVAQFINGLLNGGSWNQVLIAVKGVHPAKAAIDAARSIVGPTFPLNIIHVHEYSEEYSVSKPGLRTLRPNQHADNWMQLYHPDLNLAPFQVCNIAAKCLKCGQHGMDPICMDSCHTGTHRVHRSITYTHFHSGDLTRCHTALEVPAVGGRNPALLTQTGLIFSAIGNICKGPMPVPGPVVVAGLLTAGVADMAFGALRRQRLPPRCISCHGLEQDPGCRWTWDCCEGQHGSQEEANKIKPCNTVGICQNCEGDVSGEGCVIECTNPNCGKTSDKGGFLPGCAGPGAASHNIITE